MKPAKRSQPLRLILEPLGERSRGDCDAHLPIFALEEARVIHRAKACMRRLFYDLLACEFVLQSAPRNGERVSVPSDVRYRGLKAGNNGVEKRRTAPRQDASLDRQSAACIDEREIFGGMLESAIELEFSPLLHELELMSADISTQILPLPDEELNVRAKGRAVLAIAMTPQADKLRARPSPRPLLVHPFWVVVEDGRFALDGGGHVEAPSILTLAIKLRRCRPRHRCHSPACPQCARTEQLLMALITEQCALDHENKCFITFVTIIPQNGLVPKGSLSMFDLFNFKRRIRDGLAKTSALWAVGSVGFTLNEHKNRLHPPCWSPHVHLIVGTNDIDELRRDLGAAFPRSEQGRSQSW